MYGKTVITALLLDLFQVLLFPILGMVTFVAIGPRRGYWKSALIMLAVLYGIPAALIAAGQFPYLYDYLQYLGRREEYVRETTCQITDARPTSPVGWLIAQQRLYCADGQEFVIRYRRDYQRLARQWAREQLVLHVHYLPRSRLVLKLVPYTFGEPVNPSCPIRHGVPDPIRGPANRPGTSF